MYLFSMGMLLKRFAFRELTLGDLLVNLQIYIYMEENGLRAQKDPLNLFSSASFSFISFYFFAFKALRALPDKPNVHITFLSVALPAL